MAPHPANETLSGFRIALSWGFNILWASNGIKFPLFFIDIMMFFVVNYSCVQIPRDPDHLSEEESVRPFRVYSPEHQSSHGSS